MFGEIAAYNLQIILGFVLSAIFMYWLVWRLTGSRLSAIFSGIIYGFSPYAVARTWQHPSLAQVQWFPLYLLTLCKLRERPIFKNIIFTALAFVLIFLFNYYYAYFAVVIAVAFGIWVLIKEGKYFPEIVRAIGLSLAIAFLLLMPVIIPILRTFLSGSPKGDLIAGGYLREFKDLFAQSAKPLSYLLPAVVHPVLGKITQRFIGSFLYGISYTEHTLYLGWIPIIFAFIAFRKWRKNEKDPQTANPVFPAGRRKPLTDRECFYIQFFVFLAIVSWLFSQPPWWKFGPMKIYLPSFFMYKILPMFRAYCRFGIVVMLAVAVLAGFGLEFIIEKLKRRVTKVAVTVLFCGLVLFEFWTWPPFKVIDISRIPKVYYWLKNEPGDFAIAEYPLDADSPNELYKFYQIQHGKKIINSTLTGTYANKVAKTITRLSETKTAGVLRWMGVKYVVVHRDSYLNTELFEPTEEFDKIAANPGLKFVKSFPPQGCPQKEIVCVQRTEAIDVYEVTAKPREPDIK